MDETPTQRENHYCSQGGEKKVVRTTNLEGGPNNRMINANQLVNAQLNIYTRKDFLLGYKKEVYYQNSSLKYLLNEMIGYKASGYMALNVRWIINLGKRI